MKYKNYRNSKTQDNRIYTNKDIKSMSLGEIFKRKDELLAQNRAIGVPKESELRGSENVVYVHEYTREDGTHVKAHWRSKSSTGSSQNNNSKNKEEDKKFTMPLDGKITSDFGYRKSPAQGATTNHSGIDIAVPVGTPVKSIADGTVTAAKGGMRGYGNGVFVDHGIINGKHVVSEYGHLSKFEVKTGAKVKQGQIIAKSGNTGVSTGPHLHLTIRENGIPVNPQKYIPSI